MSKYLTYDLENSKDYGMNIKNIMKFSGLSRKHEKVIKSNLLNVNYRVAHDFWSDRVIIGIKKYCGEHPDYIEIVKLMYDNYVLEKDSRHRKFFHEKNSYLESKDPQIYNEAFNTFSEYYKK